MKSVVPGRVVFGGSAILFGVIALLWHDAATWQTLLQIRTLPFGTAIGFCLMLAQIAGGVGIQLPASARAASILLCAVYLTFATACVPAIIAAPSTYGRYGSFFEQFCLLSGAIALYAATTNNPARAKVFHTLARTGIGISAISFTLSQAIYPAATASLVPKVIPPGQMFWANFTTIAFGLAALAILTNRSARLAARLMTFMLGSFAVLVWIPRLISHPQDHFNWSEFTLTALITGAVWMFAGESSMRQVTP